MGFYYISLLSIFPLGIAYGLLALLYWGLVRGTRGIRGRAAVLSVAAAVFLVLPISEELWIAWNFGQACKEAGTFIHKKVHVDGFYDDTTEWGPRQLREGGYKYAESRGNLSSGLFRVEQIDNAAVRRQALEWYAQRNPGKSRPADEYVVQPIDDGQQIIVSPDEMITWRRSRIDRPTARYHYRSRDHVPVALKVVKHESVVVDTQEQNPIGRETILGRYAPWFFIGLDSPQMQCYGAHVPGLIYQTVLLPK